MPLTEWKDNDDGDGDGAMTSQEQADDRHALIP
jgi:hypothetical protein